MLTYCNVCGQNIHLGESYFSLSGSFFHSDCLLDNYTVSDVFKLLGIKPSAMTPFDSLTAKKEYYLLGKEKNVRVTREFYDYFVKRFTCFREVISKLSEFKAENNITAFENDQGLLERWALTCECQGNFLNGDKPTGCYNDKCSKN